MNQTVLDLIGNTPMIKITHINTGLANLYLKLENTNPGGSIKDRPGLYMITEAEKAGLIKPGSILVEATAGNTGLGLALVAAAKGYKLILVIPDKMSREKILHLRAMGAEVILTRSDVNKGHPEYYQDMAERIARETPDSFYINQFANPANPLAHENTTGPEIFNQLKGRVDAVVCGIGSSGTLTGLTRFFLKNKPDVEMIIADPVGSVIKDYVLKGSYGEAGSWFVEGIGEDFIPPIADFSLVKNAYAISDDESFATAREILLREGILAGSSSGTLIAAAIKYCREQKKPRNVVTFVCDSGNKYLTKMYNDFWMRDYGFSKPPCRGNLHDVIKRRFPDNEIVYVKPEDLISTAYQKMKMYDISQLPVLQEKSVVGILDESDLMEAVVFKKNSFTSPVNTVMTTNLVTLSPDSSVTDVYNILSAGMVPIIVDKGQFIGLITKIDLLNYIKNN